MGFQMEIQFFCLSRNVEVLFLCCVTAGKNFGQNFYHGWNGHRSGF